MFLIPYKMETIFTRLPVSNVFIILLTSVVFFLTAFDSSEVSVFEPLVLQDWDLGQMTGSAFLHGDLFHLIGNMIFLWIFGNAVCATVGNIAFPFLYLVLAVVASAAHLLFDGNPAIGASGAVNGIVGMALIIYPLNRLHCAYGFSMPMMGIFWKSGKFSTRSFWMILLWLVFDILGVISGGGGTAYWAHLGGFGFGMSAALLLVLFEAIETYDPTLIDVATGRKRVRETYDLQELAEKIPGPLTVPIQPSGFSSLDHIDHTQPALEPNPLLRVTSVVRKEDMIMCFFYNEGDPIKEVTVESEEPVVAEISPSKGLEKRVNGWLRVKNAHNSGLESVKLRISYKAGAQRVTKDLLYDEAGRKFTVA